MAKEGKTIIENASLLDVISKLDVDAVGIVRLAEWKGTPLEKMAVKLLPEANSVIVFAMEIYAEILALSTPERVTGAASLNDFLDSNADYVNSRLTKAAYDVTKACHKLGLRALPLPATGCPTDSRFLEAVFSYKHAGQSAGMGRIGWNGLLLTPGFGPRVRLSCCLTEAELEPTTAETTLECDSCRLCLDNCPARALAEPPAGEQCSVNKFACNSFLTAAGTCSECVMVCPAEFKNLAA